ncbi:hypothetical protein AB1L88_04145 [Tautonia sp. JC769]|uniref:hypothetical protein n=1 Tax=Tautonia sp. JC769 TaxID=3232135 RepID=UPI0034599FA7
MDRRQWLQCSAAMAGVSVTGGAVGIGRSDDRPEGALEIGSRRELFIDRFLVDRLGGAASFALARPRDEGVALAFDRPWEGAFCGYATVLQDDGRYRLYYRGLPKSGRDGSADEVTCYAESTDGRSWDRPELGLFAYEGSRANNLVLADQAPFSHNFCPMIDPRPGVAADARYKALAGTGRTGLWAFTSPDGLRWDRVGEGPVISDGAFDSQNVPCWSEHEGRYLCYFRVFKDGFRRVARTTSADFLDWNGPELMTYDDDRPIEHLYTNQTSPYFRAPHLNVGIAARFMPGRRVISAEQAEEIGVDPGYFNDCSDAVLLTTRGGSVYDRTFMEGFLVPGIGPENWVSRTNYPALNVVQTGEDEMSFYANQNYGQPTAHLRRYSLRLDGFASIRAGYDGGEVITRPMIADGDALLLNFETSAAGGIRVEVQDAEGAPLPGFALDDAVETIGNEIERPVFWEGGSDVSSLAGRPIRLRFVLKDAAVYALRFRGRA